MSHTITQDPTNNPTGIVVPDDGDDLFAADLEVVAQACLDKAAHAYAQVGEKRLVDIEESVDTTSTGTTLKTWTQTAFSGGSGEVESIMALGDYLSGDKAEIHFTFNAATPNTSGNDFSWLFGARLMYRYGADAWAAIPGANILARTFESASSFTMIGWIALATGNTLAIGLEMFKAGTPASVLHKGTYTMIRKIWRAKS